MFMKFGSSRNQYLAALAVNIITLSHGCIVGWLSPFLSYLKSSETHLLSGPLDASALSWLGSSIAIGGFVGVIMFGTIDHKLGKKNALFLLVIPHTLCWCFILLSSEAYHLYIARFSAGITGGGTLRVIPLFIVEISENHIRGTLGTFFMFSFCLGVLMSFLLGTYFGFFVVPLIIMTFPIIFTLCLFFLHDTPQSLLSKKKIDDRKVFESLKFYRTCDDNDSNIARVKQEIEVIKKSLESKTDVKLHWKDFFEKMALKGILLGLFLVFLNQFSGTLVIITYTADIFESSGSQLSSNESSIVVAVIQLLGVYTSTICVDRFGRKVLMIFSCTGSGIFFCLLALYTYLNYKGFDVNQYSWLPIIFLCLVIFLASLGLVSLPFVIITELLPNKIRNTACTLCMAALTVFAFIALKTFPILMEVLELHGCLWFYASVCYLGSIVTIFVIPETKGKNLAQ